MQLLSEEKSVVGVTSERGRLIGELRQLHASMRLLTMHKGARLMDLALTIPQLRVVFLLAGSGPISMSTMAHELGITLSACTHLVDKLVRAAFVARGEDSDDRRVVRCALTDKGQALAERLRQSIPSERQEFLDRLTVEELRVIVQAMFIFQRVMAEMQAEESETFPGEVHDGCSIR